MDQINPCNCNPIFENTKPWKPNLDIRLNKQSPSSKSTILVDGVTVQGVQSCTLSIDADTEIITATLKVLVGDLTVE